MSISGGLSYRVNERVSRRIEQVFSVNERWVWEGGGGLRKWRKPWDVTEVFSVFLTSRKLTPPAGNSRATVFHFSADSQNESVSF